MNSNSLRIEKDGVNYVLRDNGFWFGIFWEEDDVSLELFVGLEDDLKWIEPEPIMSVSFGSGIAPFREHFDTVLFDRLSQHHMMLQQCCCDTELSSAFGYFNNQTVWWNRSPFNLTELNILYGKDDMRWRGNVVIYRRLFVENSCYPNAVVTLEGKN